ncbi:MAG: bifunctional riboflavin kinase/FAD synthetase [Candidatus Marinimicrobia bacterium]|jgi:riboflavin kinase/FMN adenylyltransferase|nr:bifunctional riboflavin kinase/FAD synthetase [Candidatus Neomarinimicrobiota bacterium]MBT3675826.1 bifunctional riboflavin kinase/FAD synthetase [Candidatus Neomarinimicrobiota bacterium]MBT3762988.1 bifunctional riboflavin kinase/FAD synthetase [Candidatus Neomarinimicrobiota bacterium]MBT4069135.1 bifunctional riboflavin kinase/FAD synthetase [Candidatus Neomarinimicrobiota bacterium]MBT4271521.1 bifunctional riboflavin kinase/FAD synthetase [Candidatus Neomarinimicrobiota bacterium]
MDVYRQLENIPKLSDSVVTIGTFDGCHRGHQEIIKKMISVAESHGTKSVLITFDPHPRHVLESGEKLPLLLHTDKKMEILDSCHVDIVVVIPFTIEFSHLTADDFINKIVVKNFNPSYIVIGYDHHFGFEREGSPQFLKDFGKNNGVSVDIVEPISDNKVTISSTNIRKLVQNGYVRRASFELGWVFGFEANVIHGAGRGKGLGFPTANFIPEEKNQLIPASGVYCIRGRIDGNYLYGMCNLGVRPTFGETDFVMEVHFIDQELDDLYGKKITVEFLERIRDEQKFSNPQDLIKQLKKDKQFCMRLMQKYN